MILNKKGDFMKESWKWLGLGTLFIAIGLIPFFPNLIPFSFNMTELILKILISVVGLLIFFAAFNTGFDFSKWMRVILGSLMFGFGVWLILMHFAVTNVLFEINMVVLQAIFFIYSIYLLVGAWLQE
ncbi:hypothetical protein HOD61_00025 [archaeon]|jgi:hypothetical protein|nr:hypothetical protein [archaeon]